MVWTPGLRQIRIVGEPGNVPVITIKAGMERHLEIMQDYSADHI